MKIRFFVLFLGAMVLILISSLLITYAAVRKSQSSFEMVLKEMSTMMPDNPEMRQKVTLYRAFANRQAIDTTRQVLAGFSIELLIVAGLIFYYIFGVTQPINRLSRSVKSVYFEKSESELIITESGTEEVRVLVRAFNEMIVKLKQYETMLGNVNKYRGWKEISRIIVHEINNIISPIKTYAEFLLDRVNDTDKVAFILTKLNDMRGVLQKFREISHMPDAALEKQNIVPIIREVCHEYKNASCSLSMDSPVYQRIDIVLFKEVVRNLVKNAVESGENVTVDVGIVDKGPDRHIQIKDNGRGIPPEVLARIFEPGYSTKKGNIGIGLSIVKSLAQEQNARIDVQSTPGQGTCFEVIFTKEI